MRVIKSRAVAACFLCAALALLIPARLDAHAVLMESTPKASSTVHGPDLPVRLRFSVRVDGSRSRCTLILPDGSAKRLQLEPQTYPDILTAKIADLTAGKYKLQWQVLAADGHISRGELTFTSE